MSALIKAMKYNTYTVKACGRPCVDMEPTTLPLLPGQPPVSLAEMQRHNPQLVIDPEWLAQLPVSDTKH